MTARYKIVPAAGGNRYLFYCDISGALACTTLKTYRAFNARRELKRAWSKEGRRHFADVENAVNGSLMQCSMRMSANV